MTKVSRDHLALAGVVVFFGLLFVLVGGEQSMLPRFMAIVWLVLAFLVWKLLHKWFRTWAILFSYFQVSAPLIILPSDPSASLSDLWWLLFIAFAFSAIVLLFNRRKPIEQRGPDLASMIINGHWDLLAKEGVPADEVARLKRLTREERAALWAALIAPWERLKAEGELEYEKRLDEWEDDLLTNPAYSSTTIANAYNDD